VKRGLVEARVEAARTAGQLGGRYGGHPHVFGQEKQVLQGIGAAQGGGVALYLAGARQWEGQPHQVLEQGGFARAVLAEQAVDATAHEV
jgi:hypothetical protein